MLDGDVTDAVEASSLGLNPEHIDIYTSSWGPNDDGSTMEGPSTLTSKAIANGITKGRNGKGSIFVFASGNGGSRDDCNGDGYANSVYTIAIAGIGEDEERNPYYAERCTAALASAPSSGDGRSISTTDMFAKCTRYHGGTSAAAPQAAGIIALALEANPQLTWRDVQHLIVRTSRLNLGRDKKKSPYWVTNEAGFHHHLYFGFGVMDAGQMVALAQNWSTVSPQHQWHTPTMTVDKVFDHQALTSTVVVGHNSKITALEHVEVTVKMTAQRRGSVNIDLICPSGTPSPVLGLRRDSATNMLWTMSTVRCWGESPVGTFTLILNSEKQGTGKLLQWTVTLYGSEGTVNPVRKNLVRAIVPPKGNVRCAGDSDRNDATTRSTTTGTTTPTSSRNTSPTASATFTNATNATSATSSIISNNNNTTNVRQGTSTGTGPGNGSNTSACWSTSEQAYKGFSACPAALPFCVVSSGLNGHLIDVKCVAKDPQENPASTSNVSNTMRNNAAGSGTTGSGKTATSDSRECGKFKKPFLFASLVFPHRLCVYNKRPTTLVFPHRLCANSKRPTVLVNTLQSYTDKYTPGGWV